MRCPLASRPRASWLGPRTTARVSPTSGGCHCVRGSADTPPTALPRAPRQDREFTFGRACARAQASVMATSLRPSDWVCGGLSRSASSAGQPATQAADGPSRPALVPGRRWTLPSTPPNPPPPRQVGGGCGVVLRKIGGPSFLMRNAAGSEGSEGQASRIAQVCTASGAPPHATAAPPSGPSEAKSGRGQPALKGQRRMSGYRRLECTGGSKQSSRGKGRAWHRTPSEARTAHTTHDP